MSSDPVEARTGSRFSVDDVERFRAAASTTAAITRAVAKVAAAGVAGHYGISFGVHGEPEGRTVTEVVSLEQQKTELVKDLLQSKIDPILFDSLLSNETNRRLKVRFGVAFVLLTLLFSISSYAIVVLDAVFKWGISQTQSRASS